MFALYIRLAVKFVLIHDMNS